MGYIYNPLHFNNWGLKKPTPGYFHRFLQTKECRLMHGYPEVPLSLMRFIPYYVYFPHKGGLRENLYLYYCLRLKFNLGFYGKVKLGYK